MRVTDNSQFNAVRDNVTRAQQTLVNAQNQAGTGLRVAKPSDDPTAAAEARREANRKALGDAGKSAADSATDNLQGTDSALSDVFEGLTRARELALEAANGTTDAQNRSDIAEEVSKIRDEMVSLGNTNVGGKYVFSGYRDSQPAFDASGNFVGDGNIKQVQTVPGMKTPASISGATVFGSGTDSDVFSTLDNLISGLNNNDTTQITGTLAALQAGEDRVTNARSQVGGMMDAVTLAGNVAQRQSDRATTQIANLTQADEVSAATTMMQAKNALDAAISIAQQIPQGLAQRS